MTRGLIAIIIVTSLMLPSLSQVAKAGVLDFTVGFSSCAGAGYISGLITDQLQDLVTWVRGKLKNWAKSEIGKKIGVTNRVPVYDESAENAINNFKGTFTAKEGIRDLIARCGAREVLIAMGRNITNVARTGGRDGGVAWVRNWRNFRLNAQYRGEDIFKAMLASTNTCEYFADDMKGLFGANRKATLTKIKTRASNNDSYQVRAGCTLPGDFDFKEYKKDFSGNGGWEAWSRLMEPQNNYYGSLFMALDEQSTQRALEEQTDIDEAGQTGFTAIRGRNAADSCAVRSPFAGGTGCLVYKDIATPSGILSGAVVAGIESELQWVAGTDEMNELIATGLEVLINRLWDFSNPDEGEYIVPGETDVTIPDFPGPEPGIEDPIQMCLDGCAQEQDICFEQEGGNASICIEEYNSCIDICTGEQPTEFGKITTNFEIINDSGGTATANDFQLLIDGELTAIGLSRVLPIGDHIVTSGAPSGYNLIGIRGACNGDGSFTLTEGDDLTCTITYDDI